MSEAIQNAIAAHASSGLLLVVLLAWLEYVFPPSPGDSTMLFAFFLAGRGTMSLPAVAAAALLINRFLPGVRGFFLYAAGITRLGAGAVLIHSTVSNLLWILLLAWGGTSLGSTWEEVRVVFRRYVWGIALFLAVYVVLAVVRARRRSAPVTPSS